MRYTLTPRPCERCGVLSARDARDRRCDPCDLEVRHLPLPKCVSCQNPASSARSLYCQVCRKDIHRIYSREYRRSPRGKTKQAEWHSEHPGYASERSREWRRVHYGPRIVHCSTTLCDGVFIRIRRSNRKFCDDCRSVFWPSRYRRAA